MAVAIAAARTARPASCPSMRRESSGRIDDTVVASAVAFFPALPLVLAPDVGDTVGNSPDGFEPVGEVSAPSDGVDVPGSESPAFADVEAGLDAGFEATTSIVALDWKEVALRARTVAVRVIFSPAEADLRTPTAASSSSLWLVSKSPTVQTSPRGCEHTVKRGASTSATLLMLTVTLAPSLSAPVLHTKIS
jgi:hypothetical protein